MPLSEDELITIREQVKVLVKDMEKVKKALWEDNGDDMGLIARVKYNTDILKAIQRAVWAVFLLMAGIGVAVIYQLVILHPVP